VETVSRYGAIMCINNCYFTPLFSLRVA